MKMNAALSGLGSPAPAKKKAVKKSTVKPGSTPKPGASVETSNSLANIRQVRTTK